jgi:hypothetical protein
MIHESARVYYVAWPMRGEKLLNWPAFFRLAVWLREGGKAVINPAEMDAANGLDPSRENEGDERQESLREDFVEIVNRCTDLVLLPGWKTSSGTLAEIVIAWHIGIRVWEAAPVGSEYDLVLLELREPQVQTALVGEPYPGEEVFNV